MTRWQRELRLRGDGSVTCSPANFTRILAHDPDVAWIVGQREPDFDARRKLARFLDQHYGWRKWPLRLVRALRIARQRRAS